jgi:hypothetical protein
MTEVTEIQKQLKAVADTVNAFKSEAVQLRVVEMLLAQLSSSPAPNPVDKTPPRKSKRRKTTAKEKPGASEVGGSTSTVPARKAGRSSGSPGAYSSITQLLADGFFKTPRTISAIVSHCSTSKGHHYKASECSPALLRLLRDSKLARKKNSEGQYEYTET